MLPRIGRVGGPGGRCFSRRPMNRKMYIAAAVEQSKPKRRKSAILRCDQICSQVDTSLRLSDTVVSITCIIAIPSNVCTVAPAEGFRRDVLPNVGGGAWEQRSGTVVEYINAATETRDP